jgi:hypothetical protein
LTRHDGFGNNLKVLQCTTIQEVAMTRLSEQATLTLSGIKNMRVEKCLTTSSSPLNYSIKLPNSLQ